MQTGKIYKTLICALYRQVGIDDNLSNDRGRPGTVSNNKISVNDQLNPSRITPINL